jgi:hypothetical protein
LNSVPQKKGKKEKGREERKEKTLKKAKFGSLTNINKLIKQPYQE